MLPIMVLPTATFLMNPSTKPGEICEMPKRIMNYTPEGRRSKKAQRWIDVVNDLRKVSFRNWRTKGKDRHGWWRILEEANTHLGL